MARNITLRTFQVSSNGVDLSKGLPEKLKLLNWGKNRLNTGEDVVIDEVSVKVFGDNQRKMGRETVPIDYDHHTVAGTAAYAKAKTGDPLAGYARPYVVQGEGLFVDQVSTTPHGLTAAANYKDLSPTPLMDGNRVIGMHSLALTPAGAVEGLTIEDAALKAMSAEFKFETLSTEPNAYINGQEQNQGFQPMDIDYFRKNDPKGMLKDMTDEDALKFIQAKWCGMCGQEGTITPNSMNQPQTWNDNWNAKIDLAVEAKVKPLNATITDLTAKLAAKDTADVDAQKQALVAEAMKDGKVLTLSADQIKGFSIDNLKIMVAALPKGRIPFASLKTKVDDLDNNLMPLSALPEKDRKARLAVLQARADDTWASIGANLKRQRTTFSAETN